MRLRSSIGVLAILALTMGVACGQDVDPDQALQEGLAQQRAGNVERAAELYDQVLEVRPGDKYANYNLGVIEQRGGRTQLAEGYFRAALDSDPAFVPALFNLAIVRTGVGATQEAVSLYKRALEAKPDYAAAHLNLGLLYTSAGKPKLGEEEINRALALDPSLASRLGADTLPPEETKSETKTPEATQDAGGAGAT